MKRRQSEVPVRIYSYGAERPASAAPKGDPYRCPDAIEAQFRGAYDHRRALARIENRRREAWKAAERALGCELGDLALRVDALTTAEDGAEQALRDKRAGKGKKAIVTAEKAVLQEIRQLLSDARKALREARMRWKVDPARVEALRADLDAPLEGKKRWKGDASEAMEAAAANASRPMAERLFLLQDAARVRAREAGKVSRAASGCTSGTYNLVEAAHASAKGESKGPLHVPPYNGSGRIGLQFSPGLRVADALSGKSTWLQIVPRARRTPTLRNPEGLPAKACDRLGRLRIGTAEDGAPVWAEFPVTYPNRRHDARGDYHALPEDGVIKWVWLLRRCEGLRLEYHLQISLESEAFRTPTVSAGAGRVAIDFGWRNLPGASPEADRSIRVAYWVDDRGACGEVLVPERTRLGLRKPDELRGIQDRNFDVARAYLRLWLDALGNDTPEWIKTRTRGLAQWRSQWKLLGLLWVLEYLARNGPFVRAPLPGEEELRLGLQAWAKRFRHLYSWETSQRRRRIGHRNEEYRRWASQIAFRYGEVVVKDSDFTDFTEAPDVAEGVPSDGRRERKTEKVAAPGILRQNVKRAAGKRGAAWTEYPSPWTTQLHWRCGTLLEGNARTDLRLHCPSCSAWIDQDENSCRNLLRLAGGEVPWPSMKVHDAVKSAGMEMKMTKRNAEHVMMDEHGSGA